MWWVWRIHEKEIGMKRILITGGAGFVGATLATLMKQHHADVEIICLDNLSRKGSELNLSRLAQYDIKFVHGDVRNKEDLERIGAVDWLIECSAEPSVHAGYGESPSYLINTNLLGLIHCLEFLRQQGGDLIFLSTSRVYPIAALRALPLMPKGQRLELQSSLSQGINEGGISEAFTLEGSRSLYGATKLCAELLIQEYATMYGLRAIINRCGVLAGPWQMGKVDQGFIALWVARHFFGGTLQYMGFGGEGLQVRDVLHVNDLFRLLEIQMQQISSIPFETYNVGGGIANSVSLLELTQLVNECTQRSVVIQRSSHTREADIPYYVTDFTKVKQKTQWQPEISIPVIVDEIHQWMQRNATALGPIFQI